MIYVFGDYTLRELGVQLLAEAQRQPDIVLQVAGHFAL